LHRSEIVAHEVINHCTLLFDLNTSLKSDRNMGYRDGNGVVTFAGW